MRTNIKRFPVRSRWLRYLLAPIGCCAALLLPPVLLFTAEIPIHNWNLNRFNGSFAAIQHPPGTTAVRRLREVGNYQPTGNQCGYFVAELRSYTGAEQRIRDFYRRVAIKNPLNGQRQPVELAFVHDGSFMQAESLPLPFREPARWAWPEDTGSNRLYVVFVLDSGHDPGFDYRCH